MKEENDDIVIEDDSDSTNSLDAQKKLREKVKLAEAKAKEYLDGWQRSQADFVNIRRRDEEAKAEFIKFAKLSLIEELIPVLDSFNLALSHPSTSSGQAVDIKPIYNQFFAVLKQNGLEELNPMGETFDPKHHEAIGTVLTDDPEQDHKILEVIQKGYILFGKIIRPAKVKIGQNNG